jgi:hypothetical protein
MNGRSLYILRLIVIENRHEYRSTRPGARLDPMEMSHRQARYASRWPAVSLGTFITLAALGCASPGVPRPPSLNLPQPVDDLTAARIGNTVELHFTVPFRSTDKLPLRGASLIAVFCREIEHQACVSIPSSRTAIPISSLAERDARVSWIDTLPADLTGDSPRVLGYRVALSNAAGRFAGDSAPAFTAAGVAPTAVRNLRAEGSRLGVVLSWDAGAADRGDVIVRREDLAPAPPKAGTHSKPGSTPPGIEDLIAPSNLAGATAFGRLLDTTALPEKPYHYTAMRRLIVQLGGRSVELRSAPSTSVELALHAIYPPLTPTGLTAAAFVYDGFAIDLIWQPVDESGLVAPLAGYNLYREPVDSTEQPMAARSRLNESPLTLPAFHDVSAISGKNYRYSVTSVDVKGNESGAVAVLLKK